MVMDADQKKCAGISCGSFMVLSISVAMIIIGCINVDLTEIKLEVNLQDSKVHSPTCTIEGRIPFYLIVAGILNILLLGLRILFQRCCRNCCEGDNAENPACATCGFLANCACITFYDIIALTLIVIWLVVGTTWIFSHWDEVRANPGKATCVEYLYYFSAAVAIITWITVAFAVVCGLFTKACTCFWSLLCCKPCRKADGEPV